MPGNVWHEASSQRHGKTSNPTPTSWSCQYLLDVLAGLADLVNLEVVRPTGRALSMPSVFTTSVKMKANNWQDAQNDQGTKEDDQAQAYLSLQYTRNKHPRHRPWVRKLPVKPCKPGHARRRACGVFAKCLGKGKKLLDRMQAIASWRMCHAMLRSPLTYTMAPAIIFSRWQQPRELG